MTEYEFARTCAMAWFKLNGIEVKEAATANRIARVLRLTKEKPGNGYAKKAIIEWHKQAIKGNNNKTDVRIDEDFYSSQAWRKARYEALRKSNGACQLCGQPPGRHALQVDHIRPRSKFPQFALDPDNLQVLCRDCNFGKSNTDSVDWRNRDAFTSVMDEYSESSIISRLRSI